MENVATYSEARSEYTKQLATFVVPSMVGWFQTLWSRNATDRQRCLTLFQTECEEVSRWNQDRIHDEVRVLLEKSGCDYMEELMTAVFVAHTKVLTAVRLSTKQKKLSITVPKLDHFLHRVFRECARSFWKTPFLFMSGDSGVVERQKNLLQIEGLASEAITTAVRGLLPVKQILHDYLGEDGDDEVIEEAVAAKAEEVKEEAEEESEKPKPKSALKKEPEAAEPKETETKEPKEPKEPEEPEKPEKPVAKEPKAEEPKAEEEAEKPMPKSAMKKEEPTAESGPAIVKIDTEEAVHFSDYDDVYDEKKGDGPTVEYNPKDNDDDDDAMSDTLTIDESTTKPLDDDDVEDLDAPVPKPSAKPAKPVPVKKETIDDDEVVVLE